MLSLGIDTSCDDTSIAVVRNSHEVLSNIIASQHSLHEDFGGVVPELSSRQHIEELIPTLNRALKEAKISLEDLDIIGVTLGPGLIGSLLIGIQAAKALSLALKKPLITVNHVQAHLYAAVMSAPQNASLFPALGIVLSGGHSFIAKMQSPLDFKLLGTTIDDAIGECFDKVAKILELGYPGGPALEKLAAKGDKKAFALKAGRVKNKALHFSFSGLKTAVLYQAKGKASNLRSPLIIGDAEKADLAASFQEVAFRDVIKKIHLACKEEQPKSLLFGGGVTCSQTFQKMLFEENLLPAYFPEKMLCLDNGAMIAGLATELYKSGKKSDLAEKAFTRMESLKRLQEEKA